MKLNLALFQYSTHSTDEWIFLFAVQVILAALFVFVVRYFCRLLKEKEPNRSNKKTCIVISILSAIGWFIIAQIVWVITSIQMTSG